MAVQPERAALAQARGIIFDIQRYSLHDGPGLRTNVFFKGCSLACEWCSNPESRQGRPEIAFFAQNCFECGDCVVVCAAEAVAQTAEGLRWDSQRCDRCGKCVQVCASGAFQMIGREVSAGEVLDQVLRDAAFYQEGGGLTLTGGEPALQPAFAAALLALAKAEGLHTAIETCGNVPWAHYEQLLPFVDLFLYDIKHVNPALHHLGTHVDNRLVLENAARLAQAGARLVVRVPLIPEFNQDEGSLKQLARFAQSLPGVQEVHLLPYHSLARAKYRALGKAYPMGDLPPMPVEEAKSLAGIFQAHGFKVLVGG